MYCIRTATHARFLLPCVNYSLRSGWAYDHNVYCSDKQSRCLSDFISLLHCHFQVTIYTYITNRKTGLPCLSSRTSRSLYPLCFMCTLTPSERRRDSSISKKAFVFRSNVGLRVSGHVIRSSATLCIIRYLLIVVSFIPRHVYGPFCDGDLSFFTV